jgi:hypothetical protein
LEDTVADNTDRDPQFSQPNQESQPSSHRPTYRHNDDERDPMPADQRNDTKPDTRFEARGDAREDIGNNTRGTSAHTTGPEGNDKFKHPHRDDNEDFEADLRDRD